MAAQTWQPIETAPKDGVTRVLVSNWSGLHCNWMMDARFNTKMLGNDGQHWISGSVGLIATHWQPLPEPPEKSA